jgi:hypothetical protein
LPEPDSEKIFSSKTFKINQDWKYLTKGVEELYDHFHHLMTGEHNDEKRAMRRKRFAEKFAPQR